MGYLLVPIDEAGALETLMLDALSKYRPIRVVSAKGEQESALSRLNENFALFVILSVIEGHRRHLGLPVFAVDPFTLEQLEYGVRNWDLSKEALMFIAVALSNTTTTDAHSRDGVS